MKILHVYNRHRGGGGADDACATTIRILASRGLEVGVFARSSRDLAPGLRGEVRAFFGGIYARAAVREFARQLAEFKPDVVHVHELYPLISPWVLPRCTRAGVPAVMTCYDYRLTCPIATHFRRGALCHRCIGGREHWAVLKNCRNSLPESVAFALRSGVARKSQLFTRHVARFIALSEFSRSWLVEKAGVPEERTSLVPCGLPIPERGVEDPSRGGYVGYAGRFAPEKGVEVLLEAARRAGLPLKLAGDAPTHTAVRPGDRISFVMTKSAGELAAFYRDARMIAVPSIWYETFGIVPVEAMSHGVPVVASRIGALRETVEDSVTGLLFEPGSAGDLAEKLARLWNDSALCRSLGAAARERARERFSEDAHFNRLVAVYQDVAR